MALSAAYLHATGGLTLYHTGGKCTKYSSTVYRCTGYADVTFRASWESKPCAQKGSACCWFRLENSGMFSDKWSIELSNPAGDGYNCTYNWRGRPNTVDIAPPR